MKLDFPSGAPEGTIHRDPSNDTRYVYQDGAWRVIDGAFTHNPGPNAPLDPELGDLWVDTSDCPPVLKIFDCDGNWIEIEGGPGDPGITFIARIDDDGTPEANTPGHVLTAIADNIANGTSPVEYAYKWLVDGLTMGQNKTLNIISTFVGKIVTCEITVAEPDGSGAVVRTAVYSKVIEIAGTINKPTVLAPADGAGSGNSRPIVTDEIIAVEPGGVETCETELIESVGNVSYSQPSTYDFKNSVNIATDQHLTPPTASWDNISGGQTDVPYDQYPTSSAKTSEMFFNFATKYSPQFYRNKGEIADTPNALWRSDDGVNWVLDSTFDVVAGPNSGKNKAKGLATYWCWKFAINTPRPDNYGLEPAGIIVAAVELTFPSAQGFDCFEPGDVVQESGNYYAEGWVVENSDPTLLATDNSQKSIFASNYSWGFYEIESNHSGPITVKVGSSTAASTFGYFFSNDAITDRSAITALWKSSPTYTGGSGSQTVTLNDYAGEKYIYICGWLNPEFKPTGINTSNDAVEYYFISNLVLPLAERGAEVRIISKDDSDPFTITVDGGEWAATDGVSGTPGAQDKLTKETPYDTKLTLAGPTDLADLNVGDVVKMGMDADVPYQPVSDSIVSVAQSTLSEYDQRFTWSDAANFDSVEYSGLYPFTAMFDGQANSFYGAQTPGQPGNNGRIIWNAPSGANLSGSVWLCAGDNASDSSYPSPIVYINGSATPAEQNSKTPAGVGYGFHIYEFKNYGPVTKVEIAPDPATENAVIMSIGVGNLLVD